VAVVIDVLRATTTIVTALAAGAEEVVPCLEVADAQRLASAEPSRCVLGGERGGLKIEGFALGNSPAEYTTEAVGGKKVIFTTTNGTRAMQHCRTARRVLIAAMVNYSAICRELQGESRVDIVCAGTDRHITREDTLLAGAIVSELTGRGAVASGGSSPERTVELNDQAEIAADAWRAAVGQLTGESLVASALRSSLGGRNLIEIGHENDIDLAAQIDRFDVVAELDLVTWSIRRRR
jgi:2-phosphosulfolactate phosphatase